MLLIRFLIIAISIVYLLRMLGRLLLPALFRGMVNKAQAQQGDFNQNYRSERRQKEGTVKIDFIPPDANKSAIPDSEGEFVKYEEIK
jgi:hypothetical protein